jgi:type IV secretion system protein VirB4
MFQLWGLSLSQKSYYDRANTEQTKFVPWFATAGAACSIVPIARFIGPNIFALKGGGYGCLFTLTGIDEEGLTDQELDARMRSIEGALRGLPEGSCLYQYTRVRSGFELPRQTTYDSPVTQVFVDRYFCSLPDRPAPTALR